MTNVETASHHTARGMATRARIVAAAADLMFAAGVAATSLDQVLAASGTSKSQLYHYFAGKDDLVLAVIRRQTERVLAAQEPHLRQLDSIAGLLRWREGVIDLQRLHDCVGGCPIGSLAAELSASPVPRALLAESFQRWGSYLIAGFTAMAGRGELAPGTDPADLAVAVLSAVQGGALLTKTTRSTRPLELALDMAIEHVRRQMR
ncbi:MAG: TetR family transcriptional regulator [Pseudonocardiales bacterium]|nr:MAG: TetR family transcriptional regulator [Pseudonocardiales bacterium]